MNVEDIIRIEWFSKHVASVEQHGNIQKVIWKRPDTGIYSVYYLISGRHLFVYGDIGDAVYVWGSPINLEFLANLSLSYFASKCQASEHGRGYVSWDGDKAFKEICYQLENR